MFDLKLIPAYIRTHSNREVVVPDPFETRLTFEEVPGVRGLQIIGPDSVFSLEGRKLLGDRLTWQMGTYIIAPREGEKFKIYNTSDNMTSWLIASIGPYCLRLHVMPSSHDTIEVLLGHPHEALPDPTLSALHRGIPADPQSH